ncbi:helix-turn-helix transcriptional regulator [Stenotrophomonas sp. PS02289]|uniref:helix-turn-helix domain-containing protein n=1 Tax=Stenotrophomonas sp. PS02289 TaxID=2991422 RepID=UPI00249B6C54|nr:helix-turn-helix transcriptional regulator [Stenotrophomonas sp. PS02289]
MRIQTTSTDDAILIELGQRLATLRLSQDITQEQLASAAGVSKRTVQRLEDGSPAQLVNLIRCLRVLGQLTALDALLPPDAPNPIDLLERRGQARQRARPSVAEPPPTPWVWGDQK